MRFTKKFVCDFIENSNRIENIEYIREDIETVYDQYKKRKKKNPRFYMCPEITSTLDALEWVKAHKHEQPTLNLIRELHGVAMSRVMSDVHKGSYRTTQVQVGGQQCPNSAKIHQMLQIFCERWDDDLSITFPEECGAGIAVPGNELLDKKPGIITPDDFDSQYLRHMEFEYIHPFIDGNGRSGRLLYLWDDLYHGKKHKVIKYTERHLYYVTLRLYRSLLRPTLDVKTRVK